MIAAATARAFDAAAELAPAGVEVLQLPEGRDAVSAARAEEAVDEHGNHSDRGRRYLVTLEDGPPLDVTVVDREQQAQGFFYSVWQRLTLRTITPPRSLQSLRQALEQEALLAYAAIAAGANAPKLIATSELGPDAVMLIYEHIGGRPLHALPDEAITDELLAGAWHQVQALQSRRIAHRRLDSDALLVDRSGAVILTDLRGGEIAAGDLVLRMDIAQLMTTLGLRVGAERSVAVAVDVIGPDAVADSLPLLQPLALGRATRATLRHLARERAQRQREAVLEASRAAKEAKAREAREAEEARRDRRRAQGRAAVSDRKTAKAEKQAEKQAIDEALEEAREEDLLAQIRRQVLLVRPQAPIEPVRLERIKPRTLISFCAGAFAAYFLLSQFTHLKLGALVGEANWIWVAFALLFSALTYVAAALSLLGFVPEKVPFGRTVLAQVAASFVKLVAPAAVGGVALNARFLQRAGVRPGLAVASVGASQLFGLASHIVLLATFGYITGTERTPTLSPSRTVIAGLLTGAVLTLVVTAVPHCGSSFPPGCGRCSRASCRACWTCSSGPEAARRNRRHAAADRGQRDVPRRVHPRVRRRPELREHRGRLPRGQRPGSAAPTPGGVGAVEAALIAGLTFAGLPDGGGRARGAAVPADGLLAAGAARLAGVHPPHPPRVAVAASPAGTAPTSARRTPALCARDPAGPAG